MQTTDRARRIRAIGHVVAGLLWALVLVAIPAPAMAQSDEGPVEYGAIEINLAAFPEPLRAQIVEGQLPLGGLLNAHGFQYRSEPRGYLRALGAR